MGTINKGHGYLDDIHVTEKQKLEPWYLEENINNLIHTLVREKDEIKTYRNYYNGVRDQKEFEYITKNFGIGTPSKLKFTPLIKPRVDALVGSIIEEKFDYQVRCIDDKTIDLAMEQRKKSKLSQLKSIVETFIQSNVEATKDAQMMGEDPSKAQGGTPASELMQSMQKIEDMHGTNFLSSFEIAAKDLINFFEQDVAMDMAQKLKQLALDLVTTGECYYRIYVDKVGADPIFEVIKPENLFYNKNTNYQYIDPVDGIVHREFITKKEILRTYGKFMNDEQKTELFGEPIRNPSGISLTSGRDIDKRYITEDSPRNQMSFSSLHVMEVFHCEWVAMNEVDLDVEEQEDETQVEGSKGKVRKKGYRVDRYEGVKIGTVYLNCGKSSHIVRSETRPMECGFTYGGIVYNDRNGKPYSIVGAMKDLQDVYDLTQFYRDNLIANSGVPGSRVNIAGIPKQLGNKFMERLMKYIAMKKNGFELIDPTEPGAQMFQHYGDFDGSVNGNSLNAIEQTLLSMERQADLIAATNQQMLGQIAERDAVDNVKRGIAQTMLINADLFDLIRTNQKRILDDLLKNSKIAYSKGKKGSYIVGSESYIFEVLPEDVSHSDMAVSVSYSSKDKEKLIDLKAMSKELVGAGLLDPDTLIHIILSDSATEVKAIVDKAWAIKKQENSQVSQAQSQLEQMQQQIQQLTNELSKAQAKAEAQTQEDSNLKRRELAVKEEESRAKQENERRRINNEKDYKDEEIAVKKDVAQLEREQLYLSAQGKVSGNAAEPRNNI